MKLGRHYRNLPIRRKLRLIIMATVATALILACAALLVYDQIAERRDLLDSTAVTAEIISSNSTGALSFRDQKAATELLGTLRAQRSMVTAVLYSADGRPFAVYRRDGAATQSPLPRLGADGSWFEGDRLKLFSRVALAQQTIGAVYLESDLVEIHARLKTLLGTTTIVLLATSLLALALSSRLQSIISKPIADLARTAHVVSSEKYYAARAVKRSDDELGAAGRRLQRHAGGNSAAGRAAFETSGPTGTTGGSTNRGTASHQQRIAAGQRESRGGQPRQERVPGQYES
jgi:hypothetical protein